MAEFSSRSELEGETGRGEATEGSGKETLPPSPPSNRQEELIQKALSEALAASGIDKEMESSGERKEENCATPAKVRY